MNETTIKITGEDMNFYEKYQEKYQELEKSIEEEIIVNIADGYLLVHYKFLKMETLEKFMQKGFDIYIISDCGEKSYKITWYDMKPGKKGNFYDINLNGDIVEI